MAARQEPTIWLPNHFFITKVGSDFGFPGYARCLHCTTKIVNGVEPMLRHLRLCGRALKDERVASWLERCETPAAGEKDRARSPSSLSEDEHTCADDDQVPLEWIFDRPELGLADPDAPWVKKLYAESHALWRSRNAEEEQGIYDNEDSVSGIDDVAHQGGRSLEDYRAIRPTSRPVRRDEEDTEQLGTSSDGQERAQDEDAEMGNDDDASVQILGTRCWEPMTKEKRDEWIYYVGQAYLACDDGDVESFHGRLFTMPAGIALWKGDAFYPGDPQGKTFA
ncbi:MAG: hypothetical protein Q9159_002093 [Coniocarpon cinnabarinum]